MGKLSGLSTETTFALTDFLVKIKSGGAGDVKVLLSDFLNAISPAWTAGGTPTGWSATALISQIYYQQQGKRVTLAFYVSGTSNASVTSIPLPVTPSTHLTYYDAQLGLVIDNGTVVGPGRMSIDNSGGAATVLSLFLNQAGSSFNATGAKTVRGQIIYEAA